jgi:hypothetical protein
MRELVADPGIAGVMRGGTDRVRPSAKAQVRGHLIRIVAEDPPCPEKHQGPSFEGPWLVAGPDSILATTVPGSGKAAGTRAEGRELLVAFQILLLA